MGVSKESRGAMPSSLGQALVGDIKGTRSLCDHHEFCANIAQMPIK